MSLIADVIAIERAHDRAQLATRILGQFIETV